MNDIIDSIKSSPNYKPISVTDAEGKPIHVGDFVEAVHRSKYGRYGWVEEIKPGKVFCRIGYWDNKTGNWSRFCRTHFRSKNVVVINHV